MGALSGIVEVFQVVGAPAVTVIGFALVFFKLNAFRTEFKADNSVLRADLKMDISELRSEFKADISELRSEFKADISELKADVAGLKTDVADLKADVAGLKADVGGLKSDVKSIKNNHLPHIEAAIHELSKGTPNEAHVKAILDLSHKADLE